MSRQFYTPNLSKFTFLMEVSWKFKTFKNMLSSFKFHQGDPTQMVVTWTTFNQTETPTVEFGTRDLDQSQTGFSILFTDGGNESRVLYIHRAVLDGLVPGTAYSEMSFIHADIQSNNPFIAIQRISLRKCWRLEWCLHLQCHEEWQRLESKICGIRWSWKWKSPIVGEITRRGSEGDVWQYLAYW